MVPLNPPDEYEGGGTQFVNLEGKPLFRPEQEGSAVMFSGKNRHCGKAITAGVRYILAGFCSLVRPKQSALLCCHHEAVKSAKPEFVWMAGVGGRTTGQLTPEPAEAHAKAAASSPRDERLEGATR